MQTSTYRPLERGLAAARPVATPLEWDELDSRGMRPDRLTIHDLPGGSLGSAIRGPTCGGSPARRHDRCSAFRNCVPGTAEVEQFRG
jgi:hypothetical protein